MCLPLHSIRVQIFWLVGLFDMYFRKLFQIGVGHAPCGCGTLQCPWPRFRKQFPRSNIQCKVQMGQNLKKTISKSRTSGSERGTKSLIRRYQAKFAITVPEHLKVCHICLMKFKHKLCLVIIFIHIIQLSLLSSEYLPIAGKKVNIHY